jgi:hypothetical protein
MILSRYGIIGLLLLFVVSLLVFKNYEIWTQPIEVLTEMGRAKKTEKKIEMIPATSAQKNLTPIEYYVTIVEKNIFSPERKEFQMLTTDGKKPLQRPQIVLYGVTILGDYQAASITNPGRPLQKGQRETFTVKVGERIGEYKLAKILSDRIAMEAEGDSFEVLLYDPRIPKRRMDVKTEAKPATITSTQPVPAPQTAGPPPPTAPTGGPVPASPPTSIGASKPTVPGEQVATPPPTSPVRPTFPSTDIRRGRRPIYTPPPSTPTQNMGGN